VMLSKSMIDIANIGSPGEDLRLQDEHEKIEWSPDVNHYCCINRPSLCGKRIAMANHHER